MKKIAIAIAAVAGLFCAACTTATSSSNGSTSAAQVAPPTPAQIAAQVCPPVQTAMTGLNALVGLPVGAQKDLAVITPLVNDVCAVGATVNTNNLEQLAQTALPAIVNVVKASSLSVQEQDAIIVDVTAAQLILTAVKQAAENVNASASTQQSASVPVGTVPAK